MSNNEIGQVVDTLRSMFGGDQGSRRNAYETFERMKADSRFTSMLCTIFETANNQTDTMTRQLAGLTLKNVLESARTKLGEQVFREAGRVALDAINNLNDKVLAKTAAAILSKITSVTGIDWWNSKFNLDLGPFVIDGLLKSDSAERSYLGILCLQYLVEDASSQLGGACEHIVNSLAEFAIERNGDQNLADRALATLCNIYEFGARLDWTVECLSSTQNALVKSANAALRCGIGYFKHANILDQRGRLESRRLCLRIIILLIPYFIDPSSDDNHDRCAEIAEVATTVFTSGILAREREVGIEAADILQLLIYKAEEYGGNTATNTGVEEMMHRFPQVMDTIFAGMTQHENDMQARLANDSPSHRDRYTTSSMSKRYKQGDVAEENLDDLDEGTNPTRDCCFRLLDVLSCHAPAAVFDYAKNFAESKFTQARNWGDKQVALDVLSCIHAGCADRMENFIVGLGGELVNICDPRNSGNNHVAVVAMALHCLAKFWTDLFRLGQSNLYHESFSKALAMMMHPNSKYVQWSAVTATKMIVRHAVTITESDVIRDHHQELCNALKYAFDNYHTTNMTILCDFVPFTVHIFPDDQYNFFIDMIMTAANNRHNELVGTLGARYFQGHGNQDVHKEFFDIVRALTDCWNIRFVPNTDGPRAERIFQILIDLTKNLINSFTPIEDDPDLMDYPLYLLRPFFTLLAPNKQGLCNLISNASLPSLFLTIFKRCHDFNIRSYALAGCHDILLLEATLFSEENLNGLHLAINDVFANDNPNQDVCMYQSLQSDAALALYALSLIGDSNLPFSLDATRSSVAQVVRGDLTEENPSMGIIAQCAGIFMSQSPRSFKPDEAEQVIGALRYAPKDQYGAQAFQGVCNFVAELASVDRDRATPLLEDLARLIVSWKEQVKNFDFLRDSVRNVLGACSQQLPKKIPEAVLHFYR